MNFVAQANELAEKGQIDQGLDLIYQEIDRLLHDSALEAIDDILDHVPVAETHHDILLGLLTITLPIKDRVRRALFFDDVQAILPKEPGLLTGLESPLEGITSLSEAWGIIFAMEGQETWERAQEWLRQNYLYRPRKIQGTEMFKPTSHESAS